MNSSGASAKEVFLAARALAPGDRAEALAYGEELGAPEGLSDWLEACVAVDEALGRWERVLVVAEALPAARAAAASLATPREVAAVDETCLRAAAELGEEAAGRAAASGRAMTLAEAVAFARRGRRGSA